MPRRMFLYDPIKLFSNSLILSRIIGVIQDYYLEELLIKIGWMHFLKTLFVTDTHAHTQTQNRILFETDLGPNRTHSILRSDT